jgi:hypothetical protein
MLLPYAVEDNIERNKKWVKKTSLNHKKLIYVLGWFLNVFDLQYDS